MAMMNRDEIDRQVKEGAERRQYIERLKHDFCAGKISPSDTAWLKEAISGAEWEGLERDAKKAKFCAMLRAPVPPSMNPEAEYLRRICMGMAFSIDGILSE